MIKIDPKEMVIYAIYAVVSFTTIIVACKKASDFGDKHFPMSRFIKK